MWTHVAHEQPLHGEASEQRSVVSWGVRYLKVYDEFNLTMLGSVLHDVLVDTSFTNQIVGPQVAVKWVNRRQRWTLDANGRFMFGYNQADWDQLGLMGEPGSGRLEPGPVHPHDRVFARAHEPSSRRWRRCGCRQYNFTRSFSMKFGYTGSFIGNIKRAATSVDYFLPDFGYRNSGTQDLLINGFDIGVEFVH